MLEKERGVDNVTSSQTVLEPEPDIEHSSYKETQIVMEKIYNAKHYLTMSSVFMGMSSLICRR